MKTVKGLMAASIALGLLGGLTTASHAQLTFTVFVGGNTPTVLPAGYADYIGAGVITDTGSPATRFVNTLLAEGGGFGTRYTSPSVIKLGDTNTTPLFLPNGGLQTNSFSGGPATQVAFKFEIENGDHDGQSPLAGLFHDFVATGFLKGDVGFGNSGAPFSTTKINFTSLTDVTGAAVGVLGINPNNGLPAFHVFTTILGQQYNVYLNQIQDISAPSPQLLSISGFVDTGVPEPGSLALLAGMGVTGSLLLRRRRA